MQNRKVKENLMDIRKATKDQLDEMNRWIAEHKSKNIFGISDEELRTEKKAKNVS